MPQNKNAKARGFVIVVILAIAAVIAAIVAAQLTSTQKLQVGSLRQEEEVKARAIAEGCMDMMSSYIDQTVADAGPGTDLDAILQGPDAAFDTGDDYLAFAGRIVLIPASATGLPAGELEKHNWNLVDIPGSGGVCAVRFDDNSDDSRPDLPGAAPEATEGTGVDVPNRDRDQSVYLTVIGLYPFLGGGDATAYEKAHARITIRRLVQKVNIVQPVQPGLWAGNSVDLKNNNDVCGPGGIMGDTITMGNGSCACGPITGVLAGAGIPSAGATCTCPGTCTPAAPATVAGPPNPPVSVHWADIGNVLALEVWGAPLRVPGTAPPPTGEGVAADPNPALFAIPYHPSTAVNPNGDDVCSFFMESDGDFYVWDRLDTDANATLNGLLGGALPLPLAEDCTTAPMAGASAPTPCTWTPAAGPPILVTCVAGQSPCWKLMARMNGTLDEVMGLGGGALHEHTSAGADEEWDPKDFEPIPNVAGGRSFAPGPNQLCGGPQSCLDCTGALNAAGGSPNPDEAIEWDDTPGSWDIDSNTNNRDLPTPAIFLSEAPVTNIDSNNVFLNITVAALGDVDVNTDMCCATCNCALVADGTLNGGCVFDNPFGSGTLAATDAATIASTGANLGFAVKASGTIDQQGGDIIGDLRGGAVEQSGCLVGNMVAYDNGEPACGATAPCSPSHACPDGKVIGDIHSMTSIEDKNNFGPVWGFLTAKNSICFKNNGSIAGSLQAGNAIDFKNNVSIVNTNVGLAGTIQAANQALKTFMEAPW